MNEVVSSLGFADCRAVSSLRRMRRLFLSRYRRITDLGDKVSIRDGITLKMAENEREWHIMFLRNDGRTGVITPEMGLKRKQNRNGVAGTVTQKMGYQTGNETENETERRMEEWKVCITQNPGLNHWLSSALNLLNCGPGSAGILHGFADNLQGMYNHSVRTLADGGVTLKRRRWHHS